MHDHQKYILNQKKIEIIENIEIINSTFLYHLQPSFVFSPNRINYICIKLKTIMIVRDISTLEPKKNIIIKGAQVHNLKNLDVAIP
jgi:hypothetical protein